MTRPFQARHEELDGHNGNQLLTIALINGLATWVWSHPHKSGDVIIDGSRYHLVINHYGMPMVDLLCRSKLVDVLAIADIIGRSQ